MDSLFDDSGEVITISMNTAYLYGIATLFILFLAVFGVFLHFKKTNNKAVQLNTKLEKYILSNVNLEEFAHLASHDLKSPLRSIISYSDLLFKKSENKLDDNSLLYLSFIRNGAKQMNTLIEDFQDFAQVNAMEIQYTKFSPREILKEIIQELKSNIEAKDATVILSNFPKEIEADKIKIKRVFKNLISNALKFSKENPRVELSCLKISDDFVFSVTDNGIGMESKYYKRIFDSFQKLNLNHEYPGSGLGLTMAKQIIDLHDGKFYVKSEPNKGTTFYFTLARRGSELQFDDSRRELAIA